MQELFQQGYSKKQITEMMCTTYKQVRKYSVGNPENLCKQNKQPQSHITKLDNFKEKIILLLTEKKLYKEILSTIKEDGYSGGYTQLCDFCSSLKADSQYNSLKNIKISKRFITKQDIFKHIWSDKKIDEADKILVFERYPQLNEVVQCIRQFREIFVVKSIDKLNLFIDDYSKSSTSNLHSFANGLKRDYDAVKNAVIYPYSNGILEGNNNRLKAIKRTMFGRAKLPLLTTKVLSNFNFFTH